MSIQGVVELMQEIDPTFKPVSIFDTKQAAVSAFKEHLAKPKKEESKPVEPEKVFKSKKNK